MACLKCQTKVERWGPASTAATPRRHHEDGSELSNTNDIAAMTDGVSQMLDKDRALGSSIDHSNSNEDGSALLIGKGRLPSPAVGEWGKQPRKESGSKRTDWSEDYLGVRGALAFRCLLAGQERMKFGYAMGEAVLSDHYFEFEKVSN